MKQKAKYYNGHFHIHVDTMENWLKYKDYHYLVWKGHLSIKELYNIELKPKHRHRRSIVVRNLKKLRGRIDYYAHQYRKPHRITIIFRPTWEWYLEWRAK